MTARTRIALLGVAALAMCAAVGLLLFRDTAEPVPSAAESPVITADTAPVAENADLRVETSTPIAVDPEASARVGEEGVNGSGRIFGKVTLPAEAPRDLAITVDLHQVPATDADDFTFDDTFYGTIAASPEGGFEFSGLPLQRYVVIAAAEGYTNNTATTLRKDYTQSEVNLAMFPAGAIAGRVLNDRLEPVPGARVFVAAWDIGGQNRFAPRDRSLASQQITDGNGTFRMPHLRRQAGGELGYRLAVKAEGYSTLLTEFIAAPKDGVEFVLTPGGVVSGILAHRDTGAPLPGKKLFLQTPIAIENITATTDAEGFFFLAGLAAGSHAVQLDDPEMVIVPETATFQVSPEAPGEDVVLLAAAGGRIAGRVYDADTGKGIAGVRVTASPNGIEYAANESQTTSAEGKFHFAGLIPGAYQVAHEKPEGYPERYENSRRTVTARIGMETGGIDFALARGLQISGRVVDQSGAEVAGVMVSANAQNAYDYMESKEDGSFTLAGFPPHTAIHLNVSSSAGLALLSIEPTESIRTEDTGVSGVKLIMGREATVSGVVVSKTGVPKAEVDMYARNLTRTSQSNWIRTSSADGTITFNRLAPGEYEFTFSMPGSSGNPKHDQRLTVEEGQQIEGLRFVAPEFEGLPIAGRVVDPRGAGIRDVQIQLQGRYWREARTDADGRFRIEGVPEGEIDIIAMSSRHSPATANNVQAGDENVQITLKEFAAIEGRVVSARTGQPVPSFRIRAPGFGFNAVNDPSGIFELPNVYDGADSLEVRADGFADKTMQISKLLAGQSIKDVLVRLDDAVVLHGRVIDSSGTAVNGAKIVIGEPPRRIEYINDEQLRATSAADGRFTLASLAAGAAQISVVHPGYAAKTVDINLVAGIDNRVDVVLTAGGVIEGFVTSDGKPLANMTVQMHMQTRNEFRRVETDRQGHYRIAGLPDGQANLLVLNDNRTQRLEVDVADGYVTEANFEFRSGTATIEGSIYTGPNQPLDEPARLHLSVTTPSGGRESFGEESNASGRYRFMYIPAGEISLTATLPSDAGQQTVSLTAGENQRIQQDFHFYGGGTVRVRVGGATGPETMVLLISGHVQISTFSEESLMQFRDQLVGQGSAKNGEAVISGIQPGPYTVLCVSFDPDTFNSEENEENGNLFASAQWSTKTFSVEKDKETSISVQF